MSVSLRKWDILSPNKPWVGLANYKELFADPVFWKSLTNTLAYVGLSVPLQLVIGLAIALLLQSARRFKGFFRALYFIPYVTSTVAISWVWRWMYQLNMSFQGMGGPLDSTKSLVLFIYQQAFQRFKMGYASAGTVVLFAIILVITLIQLRVTTRQVEY